MARHVTTRPPNRRTQHAAPAPAAPQSVKQIVFDFLRSLGLNNVGASGAEGNLVVESGVTTTAWNAGEGARGLAQWENPNHAPTGRLSNLDAFARAHHLSDTDLRAQLGFMASELHGPYASVLAQMKRATTVDQAAQIWQSQYEGSTPDTLGARQAAARSIYAQVSRGMPLSGGSAKSGGTSPGLQGLTGGTSTSPYPNPSTLPKTLTPALRAKIIAFFRKYSGPALANFMAKEKDPQLIDAYSHAWKLQIGGDPTGGNGTALSNIGSIGDMISGILSTIGGALASYAARAFIIIIGVVLVVFAVVMMSKSDDNSSPSSS